MYFSRFLKTATLIAVIIAFVPDASAQADTSRFEHYRKQYSKLHDSYLRSPQDVGNIAALAYFYSEPDNPMRNLPLAMDYIQVSETRYRAMIGDRKRYRDVNRLINKGFTIVGLRQRRQMIIDEARKYVKNGVHPDETEAFLQAFADDKVIARELQQQRSRYAYDNAVELNTEKAYKEYLDDAANTYNRSTVVEKLKNLLKQKVNAATTEYMVDEIVAGYDYPEIKRLADVRKCDIGYKAAIEANNIDTYIKFLRRYPSSDKYDNVLTALDTLMVREFYTFSTPRQYADFAQKYSDLAVSEQARDSLVAMIIEHKNAEALGIYLDEFESDERYNEVYRAYYERFSDEGNLAPILLFEKLNPKFPLKFRIADDKKIAEEIDKLPLLQPFSESEVAKNTILLKQYMGKGINFVILQRLLQPYTAKGNWKAAIALMDKNEICFENRQNAKYLELKAILSENVRNASQLVYSSRNNLSHPYQTLSGQIFMNKETNLGTQVTVVSQPKGQKAAENEVAFDTASGIDIVFFSFSADEKTMLVGQDGDIFAATSNNGVWKVKNLDIEGLNTELHYEGDATFTPDGMGILFVSDRKGGYNVNQSGSLFHGDTAKATDIYYIPREADGWGKPINLGPVVNSPFSERSPVLSKDLTTLYFASDRTGGMGFYDIYMATRTDITSWTEWSQPVNIGKKANTSLSEPTLSLSPDETTLYYTSNGPALRQYAVYKCKTNHGKGPFFLTAAINCRKISNLSDLQIDVVDAQSGVVEHRYSMSDSVASLKFDIFAKKEYIVRCFSKGYFIPLMALSSDGGTVAEPQAFDINSSVKNRTRIPLPTVVFAYSSASLLPVSDYELRHIADFLKANPKLKVEVISNVLSADSKQAYELSLRRSDALKKALAVLGVSPIRVVASGYGNVNYRKNSPIKNVEIVLFEE